ncbi:MAG: hypothetical protein ACR2IF_08275 [Terriglobales bacterium]
MFDAPSGAKRFFITPQPAEAGKSSPGKDYNADYEISWPLPLAGGGRSGNHPVPKGLAAMLRGD